MDDSETTFILGRSICKDYLGFRKDTQLREVQPHRFDGIYQGKWGFSMAILVYGRVSSGQTGQSVSQETIAT